MMKVIARIKWIAVFALAIVVNAQNSAVVTAWNHLQHEELDKAREAIDKAIKHEQTKGKAKTWYYRAIIYGRISQNDKFKNLVPSPLDTALTSYEKALDLDKKGTYTEEIRHELNMLIQYLYNQGVSAYNNQDFKSAYSSFVKANEAARIMAKAEGRTDFKGDTSLLEAAAIAAYNAQMIDEAINAYEGVLKAGKQTAKIYNTLAYLYMIGKEDLEGAEKVIKEGREKFPTDIDLIRKQINIYLIRGESEKALPLIDEAIKKDSTDPMLFIIKGSIYEQQGNYDEAEKVYKKALALNDDLFDVNYSLGALYYNKAVEITEKMNALPVDKIDEYNKLKEERDKWLKRALPYLEKAHKLKPDDLNTVAALREIYMRLGDTEKSKQMKELYEKLKNLQ